jgi:outer membrane protein
MKKSMLKLVFAALGLVGAAVPALAQESPWLVRARAVHIDPADKSDPVGGTGASDRLHVSDKWIPDVDISYFFTPKVDILNGAGRLEHDSIGAALQAGADFRIDSKWSVNLDVKKVQIRSDVEISGARASRLKIDPVLLGVGVGYRF